MTVLNSREVQTQLKSVPEWRLEKAEIRRDFVFSDFVAAMKFVNRVADRAEAAGHHPDIDIRWNKVRLALASHDAGGLTQTDFDLAAEIDSLV